MGWLLRKCTKCGKYTLKRDKCPYCGGTVKIPHPAKFSPDDKYAKYRRMLKEEPKNEKDNNN
ncbi:RNA-protein complex protein Nop10 [Candidatus Bathyarchaeota archaeon]|nr:MAG: RNA-protein complex protein Nop10 [Candidatus Bathyarchaeota archaeon]